MKERLSHKSQQYLEILIKNEGGKLRPHVTLGNQKCYRLLDKRFNPLYNLDIEPVQALQDYGYIKITGHEFKVLKKT